MNTTIYMHRFLGQVRLCRQFNFGFTRSALIRAGVLLLTCGWLTEQLPAADLQQMRGQMPRAVAGLTPLGRLPATQQVRLAFGLPLRNQAALSNLLQQLYDPASTNYHHYLTTQEFTDQFGPTSEDYAAVEAFALSSGFTVVGHHPNRVLLDVEGSVADIEKALHVHLNSYRHPTEAREFYAPDAEPSLNLGVPLAGIFGLDNYGIPQPLVKAEPLPQPSGATHFSGSGAGGTYLGLDFRAAYVPGTALYGTGQSVGLLEFDGYTTSDITSYENESGLPNVPLVNVLLDGFNGNTANYGAETEVALDIEMAIAMAPGLSSVIVYMAGTDNSSEWHDVLNRMATDNVAKQLSSSWFIPGGTSDSVADGIFQEMETHGQSFMQASGDSGAYPSGGLMPFPTDDPYITIVGGTTLTTTNAFGDPYGMWASEKVWNDIGLSGGGISTQYAIPSWQAPVNMTANFGSTTMRNTPDVALTADNIDVFAGGVDQPVGGTSCAAPLWAGFTALMNQQAAQNGLPPVGFLNPAVYQIGLGAAYGQVYGQVFHDITTGNNGSSTHFPAVTGYDLCTGWGTPQGQSLINAMVPPDPLVITSVSGSAFAGGVGGPFTPAAQTLALANEGLASLNWEVTGTLPSWLTISPMSGTLANGGSPATVTASLTSAAASLGLGTYTGTVQFTDENDNYTLSKTYTLNVIAPPTITTQPAGLSVLDGQSATFTVVASGQQLSYQWYFNGNPLTDNGHVSGSATPTLTINDASTGDVGTYTVTVSNPAGSLTSSGASLSLTPSVPVITMQPASVGASVGGSAQFTVAAVGTKPLSYQWYYNGNPLTGGGTISGVTTATLTLSDVSPTEFGNYYVLINNSRGTTTSSMATLIIPPCDPAPSGMLAWWRFEGSLNDVFGLHNASVLGSGSSTYALGEDGQALSFNGSYAAGCTGYPFSLGPTGFTVECWANPSGPITGTEPLWEWQDTINAGINFYVAINGSSSQLTAILSGPSGTSYTIQGAPDSIIANQFQHVALTYDAGSGTAVLYLNGQPAAEQNIGASLFPSDQYISFLGDDPNFPEHFQGLLDEVSFYDRPLSASEIQGIYNAGVAGKCAAPITSQPQNQIVPAGAPAVFSVSATAVSGSLSYQWYYNGIVLTGGNLSTYTISHAVPLNDGQYSVAVTDAAGTTLSDPATLTVTTGSVAAGYYHSLAIKSGGTVEAWGQNSSGQIGNGTTTQQNTPQTVSGLTGMVMVAAGTSHSLALRSDGTAWAWGLNTSGQIGGPYYTYGSSTILSPVEVSQSTTPVTGITFIAGGGENSYAVLFDGSLWIWGDNTYGELGNGRTGGQVPAPQKVPGLSGVCVVAGGTYHALALTTAGTVYAWGYNAYGQLGNGSTTTSATPIQVPGLNNIVAIAAGADSSYALDSSGTVWAWGYNAAGQLGVGNTTDSHSPEAIPTFTANPIVGLSAGYMLGQALDKSGVLWSWGRNSSGDLGNGNTTQQNSPVQANFSGDTLQSSQSVGSAGGALHGISMQSDGTMSSWGSDIFGELGWSPSGGYSTTPGKITGF
jgi:alpha-tubulin suppressor-like RCC1 family protein